MIGIRRAVKVRLVAGVAVCRSGLIIVVRVALRTCHGGVLSGQWIVSVQGVIKFGVQPVSG